MAQTMRVTQHSVLIAIIAQAEILTHVRIIAITANIHHMLGQKEAVIVSMLFQEEVSATMSMSTQDCASLLLQGTISGTQ